MSILRSYKVNSYRRICDICGRPRQIEDIRFSDSVAICRIHPQFRTAQQLNRINARVRPPRILPVPQPKPFAPVDTWTAEESQIFNLVATTAPYDVVDVTTNAGAIVGGRTYRSYGWAILYLAAVVAENRRPRAWLDRALARAKALGTELITFQTAVTLNGSRSGGFSRRTLNATDPNNFYANDNALICAAFCRLYEVSADPTYLGAARNTAHFLANLHAVNLYVSSPKTYRGALPQVLVSGVITDDYYPADLLGLWALTMVQTLLGDVTIGQANTAGGTFSSAPARPVSEIIAAIRAFWDDGVAGVTGLSTTTPWEYFHDATGAWVNNTAIPSDGWGEAIFALLQTDGLSAQVTALWDYLATFTTNTSLTGTFDPTLAPATTFDTTTLKNASAYYDWASAGLLSAVTSVRSRSAVKLAKDTLGEPRQRYDESHSPRSGETLYLGPLGLSTLEFEPLTATAQRQQSTVRAAKTGFIYRQQPQGFTGRGH